MVCFGGHGEAIRLSAVRFDQDDLKALEKAASPA
jgi:hypothetical protein